MCRLRAYIVTSTICHWSQQVMEIGVETDLTFLQQKFQSYVTGIQRRLDICGDFLNLSVYKCPTIRHRINE